MYYVTLIAIGIIFIWRMTVGFKKGLVQELLSLVAGIVAGVCMLLILGAVGSYFQNDLGRIIKIVAVLLSVCIVYRLGNTLFVSLKLISKLPIVKSVDKLLGIILGFAEAAVLVIAVIRLLKNWGLSILI